MILVSNTFIQKKAGWRQLFVIFKLAKSLGWKLTYLLT
jgi:hypothetical protein